MRENSYEGLLEDWKVKLIEDRARARGFRAHEIDDALQDVVLAVKNFQFDPAKSNGASELQVFSRIVNTQLAFIARGQARAKNRILRLQERRKTPMDWESDDSLKLDVDVILASLEPKEMELCTALASGVSREAAAELFGMTRWELERMLRRIRACFERGGLEC